MATFRLVHENFRKDPYIETSDAHEKLLFLLLFTSSATSPEGIIEATPRRFAFDTAIAEEETEAALQKFFKDGKIHIDGNKIFVLNFLKYQMNSNCAVRANLRKRLATVAEGKIREMLVATNTSPWPPSSTRRAPKSSSTPW